MSQWEKLPLPALNRLIEDVDFVLSTTLSQRDTAEYKQQQNRLAEMRAAKQKIVIDEVVADWDRILRPD